MKILRNILTGLALCVLIGSVGDASPAFAQPPQPEVGNPLNDA